MDVWYLIVERLCFLKGLRNPILLLLIFFFGMEEFRRQFREEHPNLKFVAANGKAGEVNRN